MSDSRFKAGDLIGGKFRVERVLGTGGMGTVIAAKHTELGQRVAVKLMLEDTASDPHHAERFQREARSAVQLHSIHTARVLDVGKLKNGEPFMVMEYLEGQDLDELVHRAGPLPPNIAVDYILQACEAFAEAHGLGMIHRDIKLKNLFLTKTVDGRPLVKVLDFGLAKTIGIGNADVSLTATSAVFGSPQYMSPEQMRSAKDVDTRSDIWSIGVCLYELLTGHVPFDAGGVAEICAMVLKDAAPPLSKWVVGLPPELEYIVARCLEKDPAKRFKTVADLAFALEPYAVVEGSAKRILDVMESARRAEGGITIMNVDGMSGSEGARTLSAWGSGERARQATRLPLARVVAIAGAASVAICALAFAGYSLAQRQSARREPSLAATPAAATIAVDPPPTPTNDTVPGATSTAPMQAATSATSTSDLVSQPVATGPPAGAATSTPRPRAAPPRPAPPPKNTSTTPKPPPPLPTPPARSPTTTKDDPAARF